MAKKYMTLQQVIELMRKLQGSRSGRDFAASLGITPQYLSDIYLGSREPGPKVLAALNLKKIVGYYTVEDKE